MLEAAIQCFTSIASIVSISPNLHLWLSQAKKNNYACAREVLRFVEVLLERLL